VCGTITSCLLTQNVNIFNKYNINYIRTKQVRICTLLFVTFQFQWQTLNGIAKFSESLSYWVVCMVWNLEIGINQWFFLSILSLSTISIGNISRYQSIVGLILYGYLKSRYDITDIYRNRTIFEPMAACESQV